MSEKVIAQRGLWLDEMEVGATYRHAPGRTMTEADNTFFTALSMNTQALHLDAAWSATEPFGERLVNSMFTLATLIGLSVSQLTQGTTVGNLGFSEVSFPAPMFHGDTLYAETTIVDKRNSKSRPGQGIVTFEHRGYNQDGKLVAKAVRQAMMFDSSHEADLAEAAAKSADNADGAEGK
jgi:acyl dehydratase